MAWRDPAFVFLHSWRVAGGSALTASSEEAGFAKARVIDDQRGPLFQWDDASAGNALTLDRGAGSLEAVDRLLIPEGHNLSGQGLILETSTTGAFGGEETERVNVTAGAGVISEAFTSTADRYHRVRVPSYQGQIGEVFVGRYRSITRGLEPGYVDQDEPVIAETTLRSGNVYRVQLGSAQRAFAVTFRLADGANELLLQDLLSQTANLLRPFWYYPPDDGQSPVLVLGDPDVARQQDSRAPRATGEKWRYALRMLEHRA